jgi:hypothetical protein
MIRSHGFETAHPFSAGKAAVRGYLAFLGADDDTAWRMTEGDLKDTPSELLPLREDGSGLHYDSRHLMERLGNFMGVGMGPDWTLGAALRRFGEDKPDARIIVESIVYEADVLRSLGGRIIRIEGPENGVVGVETDKATALIVPDAVFYNPRTDLEETMARFDEALSDMLAVEPDTGTAFPEI